ncbi:hypothetical protein BC941DRAFT_239349 [Chlamydoabsidia padenii]|nr:hypothetical protein BC941DRAFT_239349 [Chlamydoabsidia padenii]
MDSMTCKPDQHDTALLHNTDLEATSHQQTRYCHSCQQPCLREDPSLIRALGEVYHYDCFTCEDCHMLVVDKFYALNTNQDPSKFKIVCENHYCYAQVGGTLCPQCRLPLIKPLTQTPRRLTHLGQQCRCQSACPDCLQQSIHTNEACYEYGDQLYCLLHFSSIKEIQCFGCHQAILKKFVDHPSHPGKKWHPECYMIYKFWNVRLADTFYPQDNKTWTTNRLEELHSAMERKVNRIWTDLSSFEESSATCISDMLLLVAAGAYVEGFRMACQFVMHLQVLYGALDDIQIQLTAYHKVLPCGNEAKLLCDQAIQFFNLLAQPDKKVDKNSGVTQELLSLVTSLAQNLKALIRIGLTQALNMERDGYVSNAILCFLDSLLELERKRVWIGGRYWFKEEPFPKLPLDSPTLPSQNDTILGTNQHLPWDHCYTCQQPIDTDCYQHTNREQWHPSCFVCSSCHSPLVNDLSLARLSLDTVSGTKSLYCHSCANTVASDPQQNDITTSSFTYLSQLQYYMSLLKLALTQLYLDMDSSSATMLSKNAMVHNQHDQKNTGGTSPITFLSLSNTTDHHRRQHDQSNPRTPFLSSTHFANIKRAKSSHLDRITEHPHDSHLISHTTVAPPKRSLTQYDSNKRLITHHQNSVGITLSPSLSSLSTSNPPALHAQQQQQQQQNENFGRRSLTSPHIGGTGVLSATRRASTSAIQRMGSLRRVLSQKRDTDRGSIYTLFDRRHSQKQRPHNSTSTQRHLNENLRILTREPLQSSVTSFQSTSSIDSPMTTTPPCAATNPSPHYYLLTLSPKQYGVVRYIAAKTIASFAPNLYTTEEWMLLVECRKQSLWKKFKTRMSPSSSSTSDDQQQQQQQKVFGVSLGMLNPTAYRPVFYQQQENQSSNLLNRYNGMHYLNNHDPIDMDRTMSNHATTQWMVSCFTSLHCKVPLFIQHCILILLQRDLSVEGIFRKNGNIRELKQMEDIIDKDTLTDNTTDLLVKQTSIQLAALFKRYLRELPEPLLTFKLYPVFVAAAKLETEEETKAMLHLACCMLPKENRDTMQVVFGFLQHVSTFKDINKMGIYNLARVMAPSVLHDRATGQSNQEIPTSSSILTDRAPNEEIKVVEMLIRYHDQFGKTPEDMIPLISDSQMVDWLASIDTKQWVKNDFNGSTLPFSRYPSRFQPSSVPTLSTTASTSEAAISPITPATMGRRQSFNIIPRPNTVTSIPGSPSSKSFHRRSWILRKQHA